MNQIYSVKQFFDADEHALSLSDFGQSYYQIEKGSFHSTLRQIRLDGVNLFSEQANRQIAECGRARPGTVAIGWIVPPAASAAEVQNNWPFAYRRSGRDWMIQLPPGTEVAGISIPEHEFDGLLESLDSTVEERKRWQARFIQGGKAFATLRSAIDALVFHREHLLNGEAREALRGQILDAVCNLFGESEPFRHSNLTELTYRDIVKRSHHYVLANPEASITVLDLCTQLRVCRRTLQKSFIAVTRHPPSAYLRHVRLGRVRHLLRSTPAENLSIADAATRWGFLHLGNFANDYRQLFGERPSQTLRP